MKLKLDENLSRHLKPVSTGLGHDVLIADEERAGGDEDGRS